MFTAKCSSLRLALDKVTSVIGSSSINNVYDNVLLELNDKVLELTGSDGQVQVIANCEVTPTKGKGTKDVTAFAVKARKLNDILRNIASSEVTFKLDGAKFNISSGPAKFSLAVRDADEYPRMARDSTTDLKVELSQADLLKVIRRLQAAISSQTHRIYLSGAFFDFKDEVLNLVATDGHRLVTDVLPATVKEEANFILPRKAVLELARILDATAKEPVILSATKDDDTYRTADFQTPTVRLTSQLIPGQYPAYARVIPDEKTNKIQLTFERQQLLDSVRQVCAVHDKSGDIIKLVAKDSTKMIEIVGEGTTTKDHAQVEVQLSAGTGAELNCQINSAYMQDMLNAFEDYDIIVMAFKDGLASLLCRPANDDESKFRYVVMPVR